MRRIYTDVAHSVLQCYGQGGAGNAHITVVHGVCACVCAGLYLFHENAINDAGTAVGYATAHEELEAGASAVGAVLRNSLGTPVGAISFGGPTSRLTPRRVKSLAQELVTVAERLASLLHAME